jgi:putative transposase
MHLQLDPAADAILVAQVLLSKPSLKIPLFSLERTISRLVPKRRTPPSQTWRTFLTNHVRDLVSLDFFMVPTAAWTAQQIVEAFPDNTAPSYLLRDGDYVYGHAFRQRAKGMGIGEVLTAPSSPWQNPFAERLIGSIRREYLDHVLVLGPSHLRRILARYFSYYHRARTHLALDKDAPDVRPVEGPEAGGIVPIPEVGGLHHRYIRQAA